AFLALPAREFEVRPVTQGAVDDSLLLLPLDTHSYSFPTKYAHRKATVVATVEEVRVIHQDQLLAQHIRCGERNRPFYEPIHYLPLLKRQPGGLEYARLLEGRQLPRRFDLLRRRLEADDDRYGIRACIRI